MSFQEFNFAFYRVLGPAVFERISPDPETYTEGTGADYAVDDLLGFGRRDGRWQATSRPPWVRPDAGCISG